MSAEQNKQIIQDMYAAFGRGDVQTIVDRCSDDVKWMTHLDPIVPWSGDWNGRDRVPKFFDAIFNSVDTTEFDPQEWVAEGDTVVSLGTYGCKVRATGKESRTRWVFIWKLRDGKVYSYEQFHDHSIADAFQ